MRLRRNAVNHYVAAVVVLALAGLVYDAASSGHHLLGPSPDAFWLLAVCGLISELMPLRWLAYDNSGEVTGSWTFVMAMLLIASPIAAISATAILFLLADLRSRKHPIKVAFNVSNIVLSLSLGAAILGVSGQAGELQRGGQPDLFWFAAAALAFVTAFGCNTLLTCEVIARSAGMPLRAVLREHGTDALPTDGMLLALAPIFVITAQRSLLLVPPLLVTTAVVYRTARLSLSRHHEATHDLMTGLANRRLFDGRLERALGSALKRNERVGLILIDLDRFKVVNDNLGHPVGDEVLTEVARRLQQRCRPGDLLARMGGDEFALILPRVSSPETAADVASRVLEAFDEPIAIEGFPLALRASAGVAVAPDHADTSRALLRRADEAMYSAKNEHTGVHVHRPGHDGTAVGRLGLLNDLARAVDAEELFLEYQPQVDLETNQAVGVEALIRWGHPTVGVVPPNVFMPLAEQTELIRPITELVLNRALAQLAEWMSQGRRLRVAVNISVRNLEDPSFPHLVARVLSQNGVAPSDLVIEITENTTALDSATVRAVMQELSDLGTGLAIDDFGTGYSSIIQLRNLPVNQIKLDKQFVGKMADDSRNGLIVRAILQLAHALGVETVGEGVEDELVASLLRDLGCEQAQGFLFARPMSPEDICAWLDRRDRWTLPVDLHPNATGPNVPRS